jgi:hypothetical protein
MRRVWVSRASRCVAALVAVTALAAPGVTSRAAADDPIDVGPGLECPTTWSESWHVDHFDKVYPNLQTYRGVILCVGMADPTANDPRVYLQILRTDLGADMRIVSDPEHPNGGGGGGLGPLEQFNKHTAEEWFMGMGTYNPVPSADRLFSATTAGFFVDDSDNPTTMLSLPETDSTYVWPVYPDEPPRPNGRTVTWGWAWATEFYPPEQQDFAWNAEKRYLVDDYQDPARSTEVTIGDFPTHYETINYNNGTYLWDYLPDAPMSDGIVGFAPRQPSGIDVLARHTFVGVRDGVTADQSNYQEVAILSTAHVYSIDEMGFMLDDLSIPESNRIQLDGGHSAEMFNKLGPQWSMQGSPTPTERRIASVLAVYEY